MVTQTRRSANGHSLRAERIWNSARAIESGDPVDLYLRVTRRMPLSSYPATLRCHPALPYRESDEATGLWLELGRYPALLARWESPAKRLISVHAIYLSKDGHKAPVETVKKHLGKMPDDQLIGGALRLFDPVDGVLAVAEGVETGLAIHCAKGFPVWSSASATNMASMELPRCIERALIYGDRDKGGAGQRGAHGLAERLGRQGIQVDVFLPPKSGEDWLDVFIAGGELP